MSPAMRRRNPCWTGVRCFKCDRAHEVSTIQSVCAVGCQVPSLQRRSARAESGASVIFCAGAPDNTFLKTLSLFVIMDM
jgi:hypothetical protein